MEIKKIAILSCLNSNKVCTGAACFKAFSQRTKAFSLYDADTEMVAFMYCNGCGIDPKTDAGILEKVERLQTIGTQTVHLGICTKNRDGIECPTILEIAEMLEQKGIEIIHGTH